MPYTKDSGEKRLQKSLGTNYSEKTNKNIFKLARTQPSSAQTASAKAKSGTAKTDEWNIPEIEVNINIPEIGAPDDVVQNIETPEIKPDTKKHTNNTYNMRENTGNTTGNNAGTKPSSNINFNELFNTGDSDNKSEGNSDDEQERLSLRDIVFIIALNFFIPVMGGIIYYVILSSKGSKQKAVQSIVLSLIVSLPRIIYLYNK
ncbi:MAG: hypothetical protein LBR10_16320 [Prevotellaceae bacterium]|jgi:hypothetical protein|nr:hypothetical protein [Prevotellaceae bacterium]